MYTIVFTQDNLLYKIIAKNHGNNYYYSALPLKKAAEDKSIDSEVSLCTVYLELLLSLYTLKLSVKDSHIQLCNLVKPVNTGLAVSIWTGAWHIARHINLRRAIKKRRKFHSETKIQSLAILSCTTEYRVLFAFVPFSFAT